MIHPQNAKIVPFTPSAGSAAIQTVATNNTSPILVDTLQGDARAHYAQVVIETIPYDGTNSTKFNTIKLQQGDATNALSDVSGFIGTTNSTAAAGEFIIPGNPTLGGIGNKIVLNVDLKSATGRYLGLVLASGSTSANANRFVANAHFYRLSESPAPSEQIGAGVVVNG